MTPFLNRALADIGEANGRTLSGLAMPWDRVAMVRDLVRGRVTDPYAEAFAPSSTDVSRAQHASFPVFAGHDVGTEPLGVVSFSRSDEGLMFDAPLSNTPRANDFLELAKDGAMRSVSIQFRPVKATRRQVGDVRDVLYRTEVGLRHLALAPTGYGQYEDAQVYAVRAELDDTVAGAVQAADAAIDAAAKCLDPTDDDYNVGQAQALITAAQLAVDVALSMLGAVDADDAVEADDDPSDPMMALPARMALVWATVARRRQVERITVPDLGRADFKDTGGLKPVEGSNPNDARFPITDESSLGKAMQALGRVKPGDRARVIAHIKERASALGLTKTDTWQNRNPDIYG